MANSGPVDESMTRQRWTDAALAVLAVGGIDAVKVETLATSLSVTKGSFYWHFADRQDLLTAMLERWEERATTRIIGEIDETVNGDPIEPLRRLVHLVFRADPPAGRVETAIRAWATTDELAAKTLQRVDARRLTYVAGLLRPLGHTPASARRRARLLYRAMIGEFLWRTADGPAITTSDLADLVDLLAWVKPPDDGR
ncbi:MAG: TetR/AcrR family transcriptional regulator [Acidimicrobiia bacterium]|nr:TetR/AcrR family transcriptional regulator [Acidimicrobiia bacterium]